MRFLYPTFMEFWRDGSFLLREKTEFLIFLDIGEDTVLLFKCAASCDWCLWRPFVCRVRYLSW